MKNDLKRSERLYYSILKNHIFIWFQYIQRFITNNPKFSIYYSKNAVILSIANDILEFLWILLTEIHINANEKIIWIDRTTHFQQNIRLYNNAISFISLDMKLDRVIINILNMTRVYTFRIQNILYHFMNNLLSSFDERSCFA